MDTLNKFNEIFPNNKKSKITNNIINDLIDKLYIFHQEDIKKKYLNKNDIDILYRWSLYLAVNTFFDRIFRALYIKEYNEVNLNYNIDFIYFNNSAELAHNLYNNNKLNFKLIFDLVKVIKGHNVNNKKILLFQNKKKISNKNWTFVGLYNFFNRLILNKVKIFFYKKDHMYENCLWLNCIFKNHILFKDIGNSKYEINYEYRKNIRSIFHSYFQTVINYKIFESFNLTDNVKNKICEIFSQWVDCSIPLSLLEGMEEKSLFYEKYLKKNRKIKFFHITTGVWTNDNIKIFIILLKKNHIKIVGHDHGINNYIPLFDKNSPFYKGLFQFYYEDYFFSWGLEKIDIWKNVEDLTNTKIFNLGSVYLDSLNKKNKINNYHKNKFTIFFPESPSRKFMANLEEISPEENFLNKNNLCKLLNVLLIKFPNLEIIYKNFSGEYEDDYFVEYFKEYIKENRVILTKEKAVEIFLKIDLVLFDMLSTGFAECINMNIPSVIFSNNFDLNLSSNYGKNINKELYDNSILFYKNFEGVKIISEIISNKKINFKKSLIEKIKKNICHPISRDQFLIKMKNILENN